jgi:RNA polymerase sigma-70 factor (TIGR02952 family)
LLTFFVQAIEAANKIASSTAEAFADLYREYLPKVYRYISYRVADSHQAEDLTSIVFEKALTKFKSYSSKKAAFSTWIFSIARNTLIDHYRANAKQPAIQVENMPFLEEDHSPEEEMAKSEEYRILQSCISKLAAQEQEIISLKFGAEMTNRQIAKVIGLSESNVGIIIFRAIRKLRDSFDEGWAHG